jgi:hypothetical protein
MDYVADLIQKSSSFCIFLVQLIGGEISSF